MIYDIIKFQIVGLVVIISVYTDLKYGKIFNKLTFPFFFTGFLYNFMFKGFSGLVSSFIGFLVSFIPFFIFFQLGGVGGGDVKLLAGIGSWVGYPEVLWIIFMTSISGLFISILVSLFKGKIEFVLKGAFREGKESVRNFIFSLIAKNPEFLDKNREFKLYVPYSLAIASGTFLGLIINFSL
ncbi:MAG: A24 family peptidase [candidate division WOR-3 bacterium]